MFCVSQGFVALISSCPGSAETILHYGNLQISLMLSSAIRLTETTVLEKKLKGSGNVLQQFMNSVQSELV